MNILLVDDHALIRDALRAILAEVAAGAVVTEADSARKAMELVANACGEQWVILDLGLPDGDGLQVLQALREGYPDVGVAVLSSSTEPDVMAQVLDMGAVGFIPKSAPRAVMLNALRLIFAGGVYIPPEAWPARRWEAAPNEQAPTPAELGLTERQLHVLAMLVQGSSNKSIARSLLIAEVTVKHHVTALMRALKARNRTGLAATIARYGWRLPDIS